VAPSDPPGNPAIAAALISVSIAIFVATVLILHRFWLSRSKRRRKAKANLNEFEMLAGNLPSSVPYSLGVVGSLSGIMLTGPSMGTAIIASSDSVERRKFSVIDISPEAALRLELARHTALPFLSVASTSSDPRFVQIEGTSNPYLPIARPHDMTIDSFVPSISGIVEKPLPRLPSLARSSYPLRALQLPQMLTQPGPISPGALSSTSSSSSHSRSESGASLFSFIQNRTSSIPAENEDMSMPSSIPIPAAVAIRDARYSSGGQVVAGNKLNDHDQINTTYTYNTEPINPLIHSGQDARQTLPPPWFERTPSTSRAHQQTIDNPARMSHHRLAIKIPEPLQTTRRYSYHPLSRTLSTATTLTTPPPPPYTPLDTNFEVPPLPQKARLRSSRRLNLATTSPLDSPTSSHPPRQQIPRSTPCTNDSKASLRSQFNQQQAGSNEHGTALFARRRSNSLPFQNTTTPCPISTRGQPRIRTLRPLQINTGTGMTSPLWLPGTIDEITSVMPSRGAFTIDE
jgi:hypothetical protein